MHGVKVLEQRANNATPNFDQCCPLGLAELVAIFSEAWISQCAHGTVQPVAKVGSEDRVIAFLAARFEPFGYSVGQDRILDRGHGSLSSARWHQPRPAIAQHHLSQRARFLDADQRPASQGHSQLPALNAGRDKEAQAALIDLKTKSAQSLAPQDSPGRGREPLEQSFREGYNCHLSGTKPVQNR